MKSYKIVLLVMAFGAGLTFLATNTPASMSDYTADPPFVVTQVDPNVMLDMSIETPMQGAAYNDQNNTASGGSCGGRVNIGGINFGACYSTTQDYLGIFDPKKCYTYSGGRFVPSVSANSDHSCPGGGAWSGNLLNWATMTAIDEFRWGLTGGNRVVDTTAETVVERANQTLGMDDSWFPRKVIRTTNNVAPSTVTPYTDTTIYIYNHGYQMDVGNSTSSPSNKAANLSVRSKVCDPSKGLEDNCVSYGSYYKPQGLIQNNATRMRFALMSYLKDDNQSRNGGVLRANMKYVGPKLPDGTVNLKAEFDTNGLLIANPDTADATASGVTQSGVINYLNKFGANGYKSYDPAGELFYECVRYYKHIGATPENYSSLTSAMKDGFPVIPSASWLDPIEHSCQKNYIVGINDANPWLDKRLPGTYFLASPFHGQTLIGADYGAPSNPDGDINVTNFTNTVGDANHEGLNGTSQCIGCTASNCDLNATNKIIPGLGEVMGTCPGPGKQNSYYIAGLAYYAHTTDLRTGLGMDGKQTITTFMIDTQEYNANPLVGRMNMLWLAGKWGGFDDIYPDPTNPDDTDHKIHDASQWDKNGDGVPDNYVLASDPKKLVDGLTKAFTDILKGVSSGTAASVVSNSESGEGAVFQSIFYPFYSDSDCTGLTTTHEVAWTGDVHALLVDNYGNMREDTGTPGNRTLDLATDKIIVFDGQDVYKITDTDGNGQLDPGVGKDYIDTNGNGKLDVEEVRAQFASTKTTLKNIQYLWSSAKWLNDISDADITTQRSSYSAVEHKRYLFTFVDTNGDMVAQGGEVIGFTAANDSQILPYIHLFTPFGFNATSPPPGISATDFSSSTYHTVQADRIINYIRGHDQGQDSTSLSSSIIPKMRSRQAVTNCADGTLKTLRQGDVVDSTPTVATSPAENFDQLYGDASFGAFLAQYRHRRNVVYAGSNDGIFHAYNGGFYDSDTKKFWLGPYNTGTGTFSDTGMDLGAELWGYIPFNLLPHLYWLTDPSYAHIYYADLKPKIFDAKIFTPDSTHINGWGTVLVGGMRLGGGKIGTDKNHNGVYDPATDQYMKSAYFIMDITDPESPPTLLAEVSFDDLGFTTSYPTVITMNPNDTSGANKWYLVLGSGPHGAGGADSTALHDVTSDQAARVYLIDLKQLATNHVLVDQNGAALPGPSATPTPPFTTFSGNLDPSLNDPNSFISDMITVDRDLDYNSDVVYFGTQSGTDSTNWGGKLRRIVLDDGLATIDPADHTIYPLNPLTWIGNSLLFDAGRPITGAPSAAKDPDGNLWVYFGTGRFMNRSDITYDAVQSFYGIKEPWILNHPKDTDSSNDPDAVQILTWAQVAATDLLDVSNATVYAPLGGGTADTAEVTGTGVTDGIDGTLPNGIISFKELKAQIATMAGWKLDFPDTLHLERNLGQAAILGDITTFTTYTPSSDPCEFGGTSNLYSLYYTTGTAYFADVIGYGTFVYHGKQEINKKISLGQGMTTTPNVHVGGEAGSKAYIQSSTGAIQTIEQKNPGIMHSGTTSWREVQ